MPQEGAAVAEVLRAAVPHHAVREGRRGRPRRSDGAVVAPQLRVGGQGGPQLVDILFESDVVVLKTVG